MADKRKLQGEIDRCLKKVTEGVEAFEDIWQKVQAATNANQKEKYEADLKKEIKKLQRLRDQIKTWAASNDIKDKRPLLDNRKLIETQMERFKVVERETKTKAYSKEGLGQANKVDPAQREKEECREWLNDSIDRLKLQIDQYESQIETFHAGTKKKKIDKEKQDRIEELQERIATHRFHIRKLEAILRLLDNESLEVDNKHPSVRQQAPGRVLLSSKVNKVKEDVEYYIENCEEPDFIDDEGLYDEFDLDSDLALSTEFVMRSPLDGESREDEDEAPSPGSSVNSSSGFTGIPSSPSSKVSTASVEEDFKKNSPRKHTKSSSTSSTSSSNGILCSSSIPIVSSTPPVSTTPIKPPKPSSVSSTTNSLISSTASPSAVPLPSTLPLLNHVSVSKTNSGNPSSKAIGPPPSTPYAVAVGASQILASISKASSQPSRIPSPPLSITQSIITTSSNALSNHIDNNQYPALNVAGIRDTTSIDDFSSILQIAATSITTVTSVINQSDVNPESSASSSLPEAVSLTHSLAASVSKSIVSSLSNGVTTSLPMAQNTSSALPPLKPIPGTQSSLDGPLQIPTDYTKTNSLFESSNSPIQGNKPPVQTQEVHLQPLLGVAPLGPIQLTRDRINQVNQLDSCFHHLPQKQDSERMRPALPRNAVPIAPYHHHQPPPHIDSLEFFQRLSTETLFFIFYYQEGTRAQYLAAKALKKQSWRFHTKYMMWFQRHEEPKNITDEYEQGTYIYFDFEKWSQRKREGFTFEYRFLEDKELS